MERARAGEVEVDAETPKLLDESGLRRLSAGQALVSQERHQRQGTSARWVAMGMCFPTCSLSAQLGKVALRVHTAVMAR